MQTASLIFPNQLFRNIEWLSLGHKIFLIEETLFFKHYNFHKQKLIYHRCSMQFYYAYLKDKGLDVSYIECNLMDSDVRNLIDQLAQKNTTLINVVEFNDNYLQNRINKKCQEHNIKLNICENLSFLNKEQELNTFFQNKKSKLFQTSFYIEQRKKWDILIEDSDKPIGGKWSFDSDNRKKYPKGKEVPKIIWPKTDKYFEEAKTYIEKKFKENIGNMPNGLMYPYTHSQSIEWLRNFIRSRFKEFGDYEDAILENEDFLNHSVLSPMLNNGLLTPKTIIDEILKYKDSIPINSLEGFIRQIIGWREFIRGVYLFKGTQQRNSNFFNFSRSMPNSFYDASTGILPLDNCIKKVLQNAYSHHIERLMVIGNFMLLCEIKPNDIYKWFMELYVDAYDWVMVPNIYGMSQFSDGGLMSSKPYISSSNYIKKMSDFKNGKWAEIWDGLYWRFINKHREKLHKNIRMRFMINLFDKMSDEKKETHLTNAKKFLESLK